MEWLFERTIELAAWVALLMSIALFGTLVVTLGIWIGSLWNAPDHAMLQLALYAAAGFVGFALALGGLASIDRYVFDLGEVDDQAD